MPIAQEGFDLGIRIRRNSWLDIPLRLLIPYILILKEGGWQVVLLG